MEMLVHALHERARGDDGHAAHLVKRRARRVCVRKGRVVVSLERDLTTNYSCWPLIFRLGLLGCGGGEEDESADAVERTHAAYAH